MIRYASLVAAVALLATACSGAPATTPPGGESPPMATPTMAAASPTAGVASPTPADSPSPSPSPTAAAASPTAGAGDQGVVDRFMTNFALEQPPFHVTTLVAGTASAGGEDVEFEVNVEGDISGEDFEGQVSTDTPSGDVQIDVIIVDGDSYTSIGGSDWQLNPGFQQTQPMNPFGNLAPGDLEYVGPVTREGQELHQLRTNTWIGGEVEIPEMPDAELESSDFDIFVDDEGIPVAATLVFAITGTSVGTPARFAYEVTYGFSNVGEPVTIEAPPT